MSFSLWTSSQIKVHSNTILPFGISISMKEKQWKTQAESSFLELCWDSSCFRRNWKTADLRSKYWLHCLSLESTPSLKHVLTTICSANAVLIWEKTSLSLKTLFGFSATLVTSCHSPYAFRCSTIVAYIYVYLRLQKKCFFSKHQTVQKKTSKQ